MDDSLLGIYLNDHLAGATAGTELAKRVAAGEREWSGGPALRELAGEIEADRASLIDIMGQLETPVRQYKVWAAWAAEKAARLKPNGRLLRRSPLTRVVELEAMRLGVEGKALGWRTLRARADADQRLDSDRLDELSSRAEQQIGLLERLRVRAATELWTGEEAPFERRPTPGLDA